MLVTARDTEKGVDIQKDAVVDLGKERNEKAVKNGYAQWLEEVKVSNVKEEAATEKKEGTPKKTTTSVKGKKIETK